MPSYYLNRQPLQPSEVEELIIHEQFDWWSFRHKTKSYWVRHPGNGGLGNRVRFDTEFQAICFLAALKEELCSVGTNL